MTRLTLVGGPTAILEYGGLRLLTDPSLSPPGEYAGGLVKTTGPALERSEIEPVDVVLLSHHQHSDNLDPAGRELLPSAHRVLTTTAAAEELGGNASGMEPWTSTEIAVPDGRAVTVTAAPAQHGPEGSLEVMGPVIGFVLSGPALETVYVSGDNASTDVVRAIAERVDGIDIAVLFAGAVQVPYRFDYAYLTLSSDFAALAAKILRARVVSPSTTRAGPTSRRARTRYARRSPDAASPTAWPCPAAVRPPRSTDESADIRGSLL